MTLLRLLRERAGYLALYIAFLYGPMLWASCRTRPIVLPPRGSYAHHESLLEVYDSTRRELQLSVGPMAITPHLTLLVIATYPVSREPAAAPPSTVEWIVAPVDTMLGPPHPTATATLVDGTGVALRRWQASDERVYVVPLRDVARIVASPRVQMTVDGTTVTLSSSQRAALQDFASRLRPARRVYRSTPRT